MKIEMPTKDIPVDPANLSPALQSFVAFVTMPAQWTKIMADAALGVSERCKVHHKRIDK